MNEEEIIDEMAEDTVSATTEALNAAMITGDYEKANELLDILTLKKSDKGKVKDDVMVA